jgi:RNA polymerase sigma factor (sigma-70 family)
VSAGNSRARSDTEGCAEDEAVTPDARSDGELWDRAVDGDPGCFGLLFERHARSVYNHCFRRTASWADAEELTSAVFVEAWRRRHVVRPTGESARPWLLGVANNLLRNHRRSLRRYRAALTRLPAPRAESDPADDVVGRLADERRMRRVLALVERLPRRDQEVLALCAWSELTYEEAATVLEIPVGTVRSRLARARARLAELDGNPARGTDTGGAALDRAPRNVEEEA